MSAARSSYIIWAELLRTPCCGTAISLYDATVTLDPASMASAFDCPSCSEKVEVTSCERVTEEVEDALSDGTIRRRCRVPARVVR